MGREAVLGEEGSNGWSWLSLESPIMVVVKVALRDGISTTDSFCQAKASSLPFDLQYLDVQNSILHRHAAMV